MSVPNHIIRQAKDTSLPITINRGLYPRDDLKTVWNIMGEKTNSSVVFARGNVAVFWRN